MNELEKTLDVAEIVSTLLREEHIESAVIGAMALAARGYLRSTEDFDLATCADPFRQLTVVAKRLVSMGYEVELREPDADDSLGGVIDITGPEFLKVQVVNFLNPFNRRAARLAEEAIHSAEAVPSLRARVVTVPYLVAFKLYAGGRRNEGDVIELLERNPQVTLDEVRKVCAQHGLGQGLEPLLRELSRTLACPFRSRGRAKGVSLSSRRQHEAQRRARHAAGDVGFDRPEALVLQRYSPTGASSGP
jgi:hypothetical protein